MDAAIVTVGDELLAGDIENTNATWLAEELTDRGVDVRRVVVIPDVRDVIVEHVQAYSDSFDAVIVTGGIGGTPDDLTMDAVAAAFDLPLVEHQATREDVEATVARLREQYPDWDLDVDLTMEASLPDGAEPLLNDEGLSPGCILENVFVVPGIPEEMKAMFRSVADTFAGSLYSRTVRTDIPESDLVSHLEAVRAEFDLTVGCYPNKGRGKNRIKLTGTDESQVDDAASWLADRLR
ncbi:MAG: competence/damage-inducible protein A [Halobacteriales archaeon]